MEIFYTDARLDSMSMLMNSMEALADIALQDHTTRSSGLRLRLPDFDDVMISMVPKSSTRDFSYEVASLCIYHGMEDSIEHQRYREVTFSCKWDNIEVARVDIDKAIRSLQEGTANSGNLTRPKTDTATTSFPLKAIAPRFIPYAHGHKLAIDAVFMTLMNAFLRFSSERKTDLVPSSIIDAGLRWGACFVFHGGGPVRTQPPYLDYRVAIRA